jgi:hypothetical protein
MVRSTREYSSCSAFRERHGARDIPGRHVGKGEVADLPGAHQIVQRLQHFLHGRYLVPRMHPVEIDIVHAQPPQRSFQRAMDVLPPVPARIRITLFRIEGKFRRDHQLVAQPALRHKAAQQRFAFPLCVAVGGIQKIAARFDIPVEDRAGLPIFRTPAIVAEGHRSQAQRAYPQA